MTRINLVPPRELADQHLMAEFREIKMIAPSLLRSLQAKNLDGKLVQAGVPPEYVLGKGHISFFYDKGGYLLCRYDELIAELIVRGYNISPRTLHVIHYTHPWCGFYTPTEKALELIRARIFEKISLKPEWYRWTFPAKRPSNVLRLLYPFV